MKSLWGLIRHFRTALTLYRLHSESSQLTRPTSTASRELNKAILQAAKRYRQNPKNPMMPILVRRIGRDAGVYCEALAAEMDRELRLLAAKKVNV